MPREEHIDNLKTRIDKLKDALRRDEYDTSFQRMYDEDELESLEWVVADLESVEYEYACQLVTADGDAHPITDREWRDDRRFVELEVKQEALNNSLEEAKYGKNGITFRLVRRRKAGPVEVVE